MIIDKIAEIEVKRLVMNSQKKLLNLLPKYPMIEPNNGKNKTKYFI